MMLEKKKKVSIKFPYQLTEEDNVEHVKYLLIQQQAFDALHEQIMKFLLPQQIKNKEFLIKFWDSFHERHGIDKNRKLTMNSFGIITEELITQLKIK